jgi:hypothetical protein
MPFLKEKNDLSQDITELSAVSGPVLQMTRFSFLGRLPGLRHRHTCAYIGYQEGPLHFPSSSK